VRVLRGTVAWTLCVWALWVHGGAHAAACPRAVVFTLPGTTWADVERYRPPNLLRLVDQGAVGSVSVRTPVQPTGPGSGFATLGAGAGVVVEAAWARLSDGPKGRSLFQHNVDVAGLPKMRQALRRLGYGSVMPGALAAGLGRQVLVPVGNADLESPPSRESRFGQWVLLAAMDTRGRVDRAATGPRLLTSHGGAVRTNPQAIQRAVEGVLHRACASLIVDHGDLQRVDQREAVVGTELPQRRSEALLAADRLLGLIARRLDVDRDLLIVVSPTSPARDRPEHLGVAIAVGKGFSAGSGLSSATTQQTSLVSLNDVAPTVLRHVGRERSASMLGRPWFAGDPLGPDRISAAVDLDAESRFTERNRGRAAMGYFLWVTSVVAFAIIAIGWRRRSTSRAAGLLGLLTTWTVLSLAAFPVTTYLMGLLPQHLIGTAGFLVGFAFVDLALVVCSVLIAKDDLTRLLGISAFTATVLILDVVLGARLQMNTLWGYNPVGAGRFFGVGNVSFAVLAASSLVTATLVVRRGAASSPSLRWAGGLLAGTVAVDSAPIWGADVGGLLSLVPGFIVAWLLLAGRAISVRHVAGALLGLALVAALFLAWDLSRPSESHTHLARLFESVRSAGADVLWDTIGRKLTTNMRVLRSTVWPYTFAVAASVVAWELCSSSRRRRLRSYEPHVLAGLLGGVVVSVLGFLVNDSGIVIPAVIMPFLASSIVLLRSQEQVDRIGSGVWRKDEGERPASKRSMREEDS
jgi:hypothetical protein